MALLSRQKSIKSLSIGAGNSNEGGLDLSWFPLLEDLELEEVSEFLVREIEEHGSNLVRMKLGGHSSLISTIRRHYVPNVAELSIRINKLSSSPLNRRESESIAQTSTTIDIVVDDGITNAGLANYICPNTNLSYLRIRGPDTVLVQLPSCISTFPLRTLIISKMAKPNFANFPATIEMITISQSMDASPATLFDWNLLNRLNNLSELNLINAGYSGLMPDCTNVSKLNLNSNTFYGPLSPDFFSCSPNLTIFNAPFNQLNGSIPWYGLQNLVEIDLRENLLTRFPSFDFGLTVPRNGPPQQLTSLMLVKNPLIEWPDQPSFNSMSSINTLSIDCTWASPQPKQPLGPFPISNATIISQLQFLFLT